MKTLRALARFFRRTPLHPQWLLGARKVPESLTRAHGTVLDIGSADRWIKTHLPPDTTYVALDYPATGDAFYGTRPDVFADAAFLPIGDSRIDGVVCMEVLEHLKYPQKALCEIARVLKPGGHAWLSMPFMYPLHNGPYDFQRYTEYGLRRDVKSAGLEIIHLRVAGHSLRDAGLLFCLTVAGGIEISNGVKKGILLVPGVVAIVVANLTCWLLSYVWPNWPSMTMGHHFEVRKPANL